MGVFASSKVISVSPKVIDNICQSVCRRLLSEGYETAQNKLSSGNTEVSITKGNSFQAVFGLKTALKVTLTPLDDTSFLAEAGVGIFGLQAIPTVGMLFVACPILIPQIWGLIKQAELDDYVLRLLEESAQNAILPVRKGKDGSLYCPGCGAGIDKDTKFCTVCGREV